MGRGSRRKRDAEHDPKNAVPTAERRGGNVRERSEGRSQDLTTCNTNVNKYLQPHGACRNVIHPLMHVTVAVSY